VKSVQNCSEFDLLLGRFGHFVTILRRISVYFQRNGLAHQQRIAAIRLLDRTHGFSNVRAQPYALKTSFNASSGRRREVLTLPELWISCWSSHLATLR